MASAWSDTLKQTICLDTEWIYRQHDKSGVTQRHTRTLNLRGLGRKYDFSCHMCEQRANGSGTQRARSKVSICCWDLEEAFASVHLWFQITIDRLSSLGISGCRKICWFAVKS